MKKSASWQPWLRPRKKNEMLERKEVGVFAAALEGGDPGAVEAVHAALQKNDGNREKTAAELGVGIATLYRWLRLIPDVKAGAFNPKTGAAVTYKGRTQSIAAWCKERGISREEFYRRKRAGLTGDELFAPTARRKAVGAK